MLAGADAKVLAQAGRVRLGNEDIARAIAAACERRTDRTAFWPVAGRHLLQVVPHPARSSRPTAGHAGRGLSLDTSAAERIKALTEQRDRVRRRRRTVGAATLPRELGRATPAVAEPSGAFRVLARRRAVPRRLQPLATGQPARDGRRSRIVLRSRTERQRFLRQLHWQLGASRRVVAVLVATLVSYAVARTVTRPLAPITATMREMAATGDLTRRAVPPLGRWDDEDARLLATTFDAMTDAIERFQREAAQRERLSSLGRLSTVIAHEIRNPLMIIKTSLRSLRRGIVAPEVPGRRRRHRRRGRPPEPHRHGRARLRAADRVRAGAGRPRTRSCARRCRARSSGGRPHRRLRSTVDRSPPGHDRRGARCGWCSSTC